MTTSTASNTVSHGHSDHAMHPEQLAAVVIVCRIAEFFSIFTFAIASALVFPQVFFPNYEPVYGMLMSFGVFSLAFIARCFSRFLFRRLDRRVGRAAKITVAMFLFGGFTMFIGFLPGYAEIGIVAPILLAVFRAGQGIGIGGSWDGLPIIMMQTAPPQRQSWYAMIPQIGGPAGFFLSASIFFVLTNFLTADEFITWGWRFPFFIALALQVVALFARLRLIDTPEYENTANHQELRGASVREIFREHWRQVILGAYMPLAAYALFHLVTIFPLGYVSLYRDLTIPNLLLIQMAGAFIAIITCALSGILADKFGRRRVLFVVTCLVGILSLNIEGLMQQEWVFLILGFTLLGFAFGQSSGTLPHRFQQRYRYTGVSITNDIAWLFGAAFAPIVALGLTHWYGLRFAGYYLLSGAIATLIALYVVHRMTQASARRRANAG